MISTSAKIVVVIGRVNMDLMLCCLHLPAPGETVFGHGFVQAPGGKGANQAIAASRLGAKVSFIGCVGDDDYGRALRSGFEAADVNISHLHPRSKPLIRRAPGIR